MSLKVNWTDFQDKVTAAFLNQLGTEFNAVQSAVTALQSSGAQYVTLSGSDTLTNKTLTRPKIGRIDDSNGNEILLLTPVASAVNYVEIINNVTTGGPQIRVKGDDTNVDMILRTSGTGGFFVRDGANANMFTAATVASAVNRVHFTNSIAGSGPFITVAGGDTITDLNIAPRSTGRVNVTQLTASNAALTTPNVTSGLRDANSNPMLMFSPVASAVNYLTIFNNATTGGVTLGATGPDTNIHFYLKARGTGSIYLTDTNVAPALVVSPVTSGVNYLQVYSNINGSNPVLSASGVNTNIGIQLQPKGAGNVTLYSATGQTAYIQAVGADAAVPIVLQSKGASSVQMMDGNGALMLTASSVGSTGVTYLDIVNGTVGGGGMTARVQSTQASAGLFFRTKGTGTVLFSSEANENAFRVGMTASATNYVSVQSNVTGGAAVIEVLGTVDANRSLIVRGAGSGSVTVTNLVASVSSLATVNDTTYGLPLLALGGVANGANYWRLFNAISGGSPTIHAQGSDTDITVNFRSKGNGEIRLQDGSGVSIARFTPTTSAVNQFYFVNSATGNPILIQAAGSDANIGIRLFPKGSGNLELFSSTGQNVFIQAAGADANHHIVLMPKGASGQVRLVDTNGAIVLATGNAVASSVNYLSVQASATGNSVVVSLQGSDTDIPMWITTKGNGGIALRSGSSNIMVLTPVASAVNYIRITSGITGAGARITADGADTDVNMNLLAKGAGVINGMSVIRHVNYTTAGRPSASVAGRGAEYYDTTINKPVFSDGTNWRDAAGTVV